jgi:hypothetical protein
LQSALNLIEAKARFDAPERKVHVRVGALGGRLYLDLGDKSRWAVEIAGTGWRIIDNPPLRFRRARDATVADARPRRVGRGAALLPEWGEYRFRQINYRDDRIWRRTRCGVAAGSGSSSRIALLCDDVWSR